MGLEYAELAMDAEKEFGISIPEGLAQGVATVGDFFDAVLPLVRKSGTPELRARPDLDEHVWSRVKELAAQCGYDVRPEQITRSTRLVEDLGYG